MYSYFISVSSSETIRGPCLTKRYLHFVIENLGLASVSCWNEVFVQYIQNVTTD